MDVSQRLAGPGAGLAGDQDRLVGVKRAASTRWRSAARKALLRPITRRVPRVSATSSSTARQRTRRAARSPIACLPCPHASSEAKRPRSRRRDSLRTVELYRR